MHNYITRNADRNNIYLIIALFSAVMTYYFHECITANNILVPWWIEIPSILSIYGFAFFLFDRFVWKIKLLQSIGLVKYPDVSGTYEAVILSSFDQNQKYEGKLSIKQTWSKISVHLETDTSRSYSEAGSIFRSRLNEIVLSYSYINEPKFNATETMNIHRGVAIHFIDLDNLKYHTAEYYTGRGRENYGCMELCLKEEK